MSDNSIKLTGWPAVAAIVLILGFFGFRMLTARAELDTSGAAEIRQKLVGQYARSHLAKLKGRAVTGADAAALVTGANVTFPKLDARGGLDKLIVRVSVRVNGGPPPDGKGVRYFEMKYSSVGGWRLRREVSALTWHLKLF